MKNPGAASYAEIRAYLNRVPVIETHEHYEKHRPVSDLIDFILGTYYGSDYESGVSDGTEAMKAYSCNAKGLSFEERFRIFMKYSARSNKTAYARAVRIGLHECWGIDANDSLDALEALAAKFAGRDERFYEATMEKYGIQAKIVDIFNLRPFIDQAADYSKDCRFAFPLPEFHEIHTRDDLFKLQKYLNRTIICLDDYLESFDNFLKRCVEFGVVCIKDQSAYRRTLAYSNPTRGEAEKAFNDIIYNPRDVFGDDAARALDDWLFHYFMRAAAKYDLPVQIHTGHMAGIRNEIVKTNAAHLTPVLEMHRDVRFDLFHGNWPYMDEFLFLGKNYPNAYLNLCWVQAIDPVYCVELMKRAVMTVPHSKLFAFGGDTGQVEWTVGYLMLARDNVACALSELVESDWITMDEAKQIAADWFFNNPNEFFKLGFDHF